jgi:hypothetical protein
MRRQSLTSAIAAATYVAAIGLSAPQEALSPRAWVSGHGVDAAGCGAATKPCRTLQFTHDSIIAAGGEIDILDPASYGTLTITKSLSVVNDGVGTAGIQLPTTIGSAITINAGAGAIYLRGLILAGVGGKSIGLNLSSAASLTVVNCVTRQFQVGINIIPSSGASTVLISNAIVSDNSAGIQLFPSGSGVVIGVISRTTVSNNGVGGGIVVASNATGTIVDSIVFNNNVGFSVNGGTMRIGRSVATGNGDGVHVFSGTAVSYGDNEINGNKTIDVFGTLTPIGTR